MSNHVPKHVAIIMDGNGRWAKKRAMPRAMGHLYGVKAVKKAVIYAAEHKIDILTLFALSTENLTLRPAKEVNNLLTLFVKQLKSQTKELHSQHVKVSFIGDHASLPSDLQASMEHSVLLTKNNTGLHLVIAINYSGQWDITHAAKQLAVQVVAGALPLEAIDEKHFQQYLALADMPMPDLLIRTSGEQRISNFLLWQLAYSELFFTDVLWPDFDEAVFDEALACFAVRARKFGKTLDQIEREDA